jgi:UDP-sugar transporter A1/2/3
VAIAREQNAALGFIAILIAVCCSGLSGVWFERILKTSKTSLWVRNFQLALVSFVLAVGSVVLKDFGAVRDRGFFQGYSQLGG